MALVFVSYKQAERERVRALVKALDSSQLSVWRDYELESGEDFSRRVNHELDRAAAVIVAWSEASAQSEFVRGEAAAPPSNRRDFVFWNR